jgi:polyadenylate-binding protein
MAAPQAQQVPPSANAGAGAPKQGDPNASYASASLYVGDLQPDITEANLCDVFNQVGPVQSIRVCRDAVTRRPLGYAYVNFRMLQDAERALDTMNYSLIRGHPCRIMWSHRDPSLRRSNKGNIFIKNLDKAIDNKMLYDTFSTFGNILSCKIATDDVSGKSRGYGFVHYEDDSSCTAAMEKVNGKMLKDKIVYVGPFKSKKEREDEYGGPLETVFQNVFVKNLDESVTEDEFKTMFEKFGPITSFVLKAYEDGKKKGFPTTKYGFVNFETAEAAKASVDEMNGFEHKEKAIFCGPAEKAAQRRSKLKAQFDKIKQDQILKYQNVNLYIKNLDDTISEEKLKQIFEPFGVITSHKLMCDDKGVSKGFGFVCYTTPEEATKAVTDMNNKIVGAKPIYVSLAQRKDQRRAQLEATMAQRYQQQRGMPPNGAFYQQGMGPGGFYGNPMGGQYPQQQQQYMQGGRAGYPGAKGGQQMYMNSNQKGGNRKGGRDGKGNGKGKGNQPRNQGKGKGAQQGAGPHQGQPANPNSWAAKVQVAQGPPAQPMPAQPQPAQPQPAAEAQPAQVPDLAQQLAAAPPQQQKQMLGEKLYPIIEKHPAVLAEQAGKITGMLLDMDVSELLNLYEAPDALHQKVIEAINVLAHHGMATPVDPSTGGQVPEK